jgi:hypothetical protein
LSFILVRIWICCSIFLLDFCGNDLSELFVYADIIETTEGIKILMGSKSSDIINIFTELRTRKPD